MTLHLVSNRSVVGSLAFAELEGDIVSWDDILYEGPVPAGVDDRALRRIRATFLAKAGYVPFVDALTEFTARDRALAGADDVLLWFDADLHGQLQLVQILAALDPSSQKARLICIESFPGRSDFIGLAQLDSDDLVSLLGSETAVTPEEQSLAARAWGAFRSPEPEEISRLLSGDTSALPFLADALTRHLEEFPSTRDGLPRTDRTILRLAADGTARWTRLYGEFLDTEERLFVGDHMFRRRLEALMTAATPLLAGRTGGFLELMRRLRKDGAREQKLWPAAAADELIPTAAGEAVLGGELDAAELNGIDRWFGGVHLTGNAPQWRWEDRDRRLVRAA